MRDIRWIFFDLGSTLIDETEADIRRIMEMTEGTGITAEEYCEKRLEMIRLGRPGDAAAIDFFGLTKTPWHSEYEKPYADTAAILSELNRRGFRLGIIANQNPGTELRLEKWGIRRFFEVIAASAESGISKPDPAFFQLALNEADCPAENAVMVGDRLDNDIAPARRIGMHTVRVLRGPWAYSEPRSADELPEYTVSTPEKLLNLL